MPLGNNPNDAKHRPNSRKNPQHMSRTSASIYFRELILSTFVAAMALEGVAGEPLRQRGLLSENPGKPCASRKVAR